jgi:hypothetical protein
LLKDRRRLKPAAATGHFQKERQKDSFIRSPATGKHFGFLGRGNMCIYLHTAAFLFFCLSRGTALPNAKKQTQNPNERAEFRVLLLGSVEIGSVALHERFQKAATVHPAGLFKAIDYWHDFFHS